MGEFDYCSTTVNMQILCALPFILTFVSAITEESEDDDIFKVCEFDGESGLTLEEIRVCEEKFAELIDEGELEAPPSDEEFKYVDLNEDEILTIEEWNKYLDSEHQEDEEDFEDDEESENDNDHYDNLGHYDEDDST